MAFVIEDEFHAEPQGKFDTREAAIAELKRIAGIPFGEPPNCPPCTSSLTCHRDYVLTEFDDSAAPWRTLSQEDIFTISSAGIVWHTTLP